MADDTEQPGDVFGLVGTTIDGRYRVDAVVGEGGFGVVYRGWHLKFRDGIAIKCLKLRPDLTAAAREHLLHKFRDEGELLIRLSAEHPAVLRVLFFGEMAVAGARVPYLVLEWLDGEDLAVHLAGRAAGGSAPFTEREALERLRPAIEAVGCAHRMGVAHRDLKPANLFLLRDPKQTHVKVLDFGIAKVMEEGQAQMPRETRTRTKMPAFSPGYGAPEQFMCQMTGQWTDVHALGLMLVELVTGRPPLDGSNEYLMQQSALNPVRPTPRVRGARVSDAFEAACAKALALKASERFQSASDLLAALDQAVRPPAPIPVLRPVSPPVPTPAAPKTVEQRPTPGALQPPEPRSLVPPVPPARKRAAVPIWLKALAAPAGVLAVGAVVEVLWRACGSMSTDSEAHGTPAATVTAAVTPEPLPAQPTATRTAEPPPAPPAPAATGMVRIAGGTFKMGSNDGDSDEKPVHDVTVATFEMDKTEVTVAAYRACVEARNCTEPDRYDATGGWKQYCNFGRRDRDEHPINCVDWSQVTAYCASAGKRLPTEEEWEYAARGTDARKFPWGSAAPSSQLCWKRYDLSTSRGEGTCAVGSHGSGNTPQGLEDMAGNVWEWTSSKYCPYTDSGHDSKKCAESRVSRGGSWDDVVPSLVRGAFRSRFVPSFRDYYLGFRCAR
jgi:formylglycine-generating enzyme required for sulfatase activity/serine/threonine protein kinase